MSKYNTTYCFNAYDLFETFNLKQLKIRRDTVQDKYGVHSKQALCASVLIYCFYLILLDIIENNITFVLPLFGSKYAEIFAKPVTGERFKEACQKGAFKGIDFLCSEFTGYKIVYNWRSGLTTREKPVYISNAFKDTFYKHINEGKHYY